VTSASHVRSLAVHRADAAVDALKAGMSARARAAAEVEAQSGYGLLPLAPVEEEPAVEDVQQYF
jgi:hypothetical protein